MDSGKRSWRPGLRPAPEKDDGVVGPRKRFRPGDRAPVSGVYVAYHRIRHRDPHELLIIRGEELPACRICHSEVEFEVRRTASHVTHDWDFAGPVSLVVKTGAPGFSAARRRPRRYQVNMAIRIQLSGREGTRAVVGEVRDLSAGGVGATLERELPPMSGPVLINFVSSEGQPVRVAAHIRHREGYRHGFQFSGMAAEASAWLRSQIRRAAAELT